MRAIPVLLCYSFSYYPCIRVIARLLHPVNGMRKSATIYHGKAMLRVSCPVLFLKHACIGDREPRGDDVDWCDTSRPGFLGSQRDVIHKRWNHNFGEGKWRLVWRADGTDYDFRDACRYLYEESYYQYLKNRPDLIEKICSYGEVIDNAITNIESGCVYTHQESRATHIQDIAVRNVLGRLHRIFTGAIDNILVIHGPRSNGAFLSPGVIPFFQPHWIQPPSKTPWWAQEGSVEDFWQSNKHLQILQDDGLF